MFTIIGLAIVLGAVFGGFAMVGGAFGVLIQPAELVVIGGAALGTLIAAETSRTWHYLDTLRYFSGGEKTDTYTYNYYYPQAGFNMLAGMSVRF